jgi:hypothetical protein
MHAFSYDHIHLRTRDPRGTAEWYHRMFGARIIESVQSDGQPRIDLDINGLTVFIANVPAAADMPTLRPSRISALTISACASRTWTQPLPS